MSSGIIFSLMSGRSLILVWITTMDPWQFLRSFVSSPSIHAQLLAQIIHILWSSKVLENVLHILFLVISRSIRATQRSLIMNSM